MVSAININGSAKAPALPELSSEKRDLHALAVAGIAAQESLSKAAVPLNSNIAPTADLADALKTLNEFTKVIAQDLQFSIDDESGRTIVKVVDTKTQEVLRQIPTVETLAIARSLNKMQGLLIREKA